MVLSSEKATDIYNSLTSLVSDMTTQMQTKTDQIKGITNDNYEYLQKMNTN
jgi:hypothetical protein